MDRSSVADEAPGRLVSYGRDSYYKPDPLPPSRTLELDEEFHETLSETAFWLGKLSGISVTETYPPVLYTSLLRKEALESTEIEGADAGFNDVFSYETRTRQMGSTDEQPEHADRERTKDIGEVLNYESALERGIDAMQEGEEISVDLLHSLHELLLKEVRSDTDTIGEFRDRPVHLGEFVPPAPDAVEGAMDALLTYVRTGGRYHDFVDVALVHYQLETIHPYGDGNGRLGRLLITLQLYRNGYLERPNVYLSEYFNRNRQTYVDRLQAVRKTGDWESWVSFFVTGLRNQARESVERTLELRDLRKRYEDEYGDSNRTDARLALDLFEQPYVTASDVERRLDVSGPTAYRAIESLREDGVIEEVTGKDRNREFRAAEIFDVLEQPPQTY